MNGAKSNGLVKWEIKIDETTGDILKIITSENPRFSLWKPGVLYLYDELSATVFGSLFCIVAETEQYALYRISRFDFVRTLLEVEVKKKKSMDFLITRKTHGINICSRQDLNLHDQEPQDP